MIGTHIFKTFTAAMTYYRPYGYENLKDATIAKIDNNEICIGKPEGKGFWNREGRWMKIVEKH